MGKHPRPAEVTLGDARPTWLAPQGHFQRIAAVSWGCRHGRVLASPPRAGVLWGIETSENDLLDRRARRLHVRLCELPRDDRPRERLLRLGTSILSDRELLALLLRTGSRSSSALGLADTLLAEFGSLAQLAEARSEELMRVGGIGPSKATTLLAAFALVHRMAESSQPEVISGPTDVVAAARSLLSGLRRERVVVVICDAAHRLRRVDIVSEGAADRALFPVREILNAVLRRDGRAFALAHNHPSGGSVPSDADVTATRAVAEAARVVGLRFLGHVVLGSNGWEEIELRG